MIERACVSGGFGLPGFGKIFTVNSGRVSSWCEYEDFELWSNACSVLSCLTICKILSDGVTKEGTVRTVHREPCYP